MTGRFVTGRLLTGRLLTGRFVCESYHIQVLALGADNPPLDENSVITSEPVSLDLFLVITNFLQYILLVFIYSYSS